MAKLVSHVYGDALFSLAEENDQVNAVWEEVKALADILEQNKEFSNIMNNPEMTLREKRELMSNVFEGRLTHTLMGFLDVLVKKGRFFELGEILDYYNEQAKEYNKIGVVKVKTAVSLTEEMKKKIEKRMLELTKYESLEMNYQVEKSLLGGIVIRINDRVVDDSIKRKMQSMSDSLSKMRID